MLDARHDGIQANVASDAHCSGTLQGEHSRVTCSHSKIAQALFGLVGFLTFADGTQEEISNNLPSQQFKATLNLILVIKALLSYPLPYFATAKIMEENL